MAENELNITGEVDRELEMLQRLSNGGEPLPFSDIKWIRFLVHRMPEAFRTSEDEVRTEVPRLFRVALESFKYGLLVNGGRLELEDSGQARMTEE